MPDGAVSGERYLRLLFEAVLDAYDPHHVPVRAWHAAADALVAAGAVTEDLVVHLRRDAGLAMALREDGRLVVSGGHPRSRTASAWQILPASVGVVDGPNGGCCIVSAADGVSLRSWNTDTEGATAYDPAPGPRHASRPRAGGNRPTPGPPPRTPPASAAGVPAPWTVAVTDDRGTPYHVHSGAGTPGSAAGVARLAPDPPAGVRWFDVDVDVGAGTGPAARVVMNRPERTVRGRPNGRTSGVSWLLQAIAGAAVGDPLQGPLVPGVRALLGVGAVQPGHPLVHQAELLDHALASGGGDGAGDGLDPRWANALRRRRQPPEVTGSWPVATTVDLGASTVRLDALVATPGGTLLVGDAEAPGSGRGPLLTAFDDRHNWYVLGLATRTLLAGLHVASWTLRPHLDAAATSLRIDIADGEAEASVEVGLR